MYGLGCLRGKRLELDPLAHGHSETTGDPADFACGFATNEQVVYDGLEGPDDSDLHTASDLPGFPLRPIHFSIDTGEFVPEVPV